MRRILFVLIVAGLGSAPARVRRRSRALGPSDHRCRRRRWTSPTRATSPRRPPSPRTRTSSASSGPATQTAKFRVEARVKDGKWYSQGTVTAPDGGADPGSAEARNAARRIGAGFSSEPVQVTDNAAQVRLRVTQGNVHNVHIVAVGSPPGLANTTPSTSPLNVNPARRGWHGVRRRRRDLDQALPPRVAAARAHRRHGRVGRADRRAERERGGARRRAVPAQPRLRRAARSGARTRACARPRAPKVRTTRRPRLVVVHHTATSNSYSPAQSASIVRGIYVYYIQGRGYCDIGYNFLVDRYGIIFEGRYGGVDRGVIGAHATLLQHGDHRHRDDRRLRDGVADRRDVQLTREPDRVEDVRPPDQPVLSRSRTVARS